MRRGYTALLDVGMCIDVVNKNTLMLDTLAENYICHGVIRLIKEKMKLKQLPLVYSEYSDFVSGEKLFFCGKFLKHHHVKYTFSIELNFVC